MSTEKIEPAKPIPSPRFSINGPGKPYMKFAVAATAVLAATSILPWIADLFTPIDVDLFNLITYGSPIWLIGHAYIFAGGRMMSSGDLNEGKGFVRIACIGIAVPLVLIGLPFHFVAMNISDYSVWIRSSIPFGLLLYFMALILMFFRSYEQSGPQ